jgi:hypothetical protein
VAISPKGRKLLQDLVGPDTFSLVSLSLAALVFSLGRLTVYAADQSQYLVYSLSALAISQTLVVITLSIIGKFLFHAPARKLLPAFVVTAIVVVNILAASNQPVVHDFYLSWAWLGICGLRYELQASQAGQRVTDKLVKATTRTIFDNQRC